MCTEYVSIRELEISTNSYYKIIQNNGIISLESEYMGDLENLVVLLFFIINLFS